MKNTFCILLIFSLIIVDNGCNRSNKGMLDKSREDATVVFDSQNMISSALNIMLINKLV
jgi:hypothetical protein